MASFVIPKLCPRLFLAFQDLQTYQKRNFLNFSKPNNTLQDQEKTVYFYVNLSTYWQHKWFVKSAAIIISIKAYLRKKIFVGASFTTNELFDYFITNFLLRLDLENIGKSILIFSLLCVIERGLPLPFRRNFNIHYLLTRGKEVKLISYYFVYF